MKTPHYSHGQKFHKISLIECFSSSLTDFKENCSKYQHFIVMVVAWIDLVFFVEAQMIPCFGILMKIVVITHKCF